jgi:hypothetical protein
MAHALLTEEIAKNDIKNANEFRKNFLPFFIFKNLLSSNIFSQKEYHLLCFS